MEENDVIFLQEKLSRLIHEEVEPLKGGGVQGELENLKHELECMRAFLRVADAIEDKDKQMVQLVNQVRDIAYDAEDVLHEQAQIRGNKFFSFLGKIPLLNPLWSKVIKRNYHLASEIKAINPKLSSIIEQYQKFKNVNSKDQSSSSCYDLRGDALLVEEAELVGIDKTKNQLIQCLVEGETRFKAVSVVGTAGLGKTTLVKKVYDDFVTKQHFNSFAWIHVSERFKIEEVLKDIIHQIFTTVNEAAPQGLDMMNRAHLKAIIKEFLGRRKYLIVLDDIWSIDFWNAIRNSIPKENCSRVVLTTRNPEVASTISIGSEGGHVFHLDPLSETESMTLFCKKTFQGNSCPLHLEKIVKRILIKCGGLPLAIVAISGVFATKDTSKIEEWEKIVRNLGSEIEGSGILQSMAKILLMGYGDLPHHLKSCFLYLSIFPADYPVECMRLARLWIAEGLVMEMEGNTLEDVAEKYINVLLNRSLIQVAERTSDGRVHSCRIHEFVREAIVSKSKEQNFTTIAGEYATVWPERVRRLSIHNTIKKVKQDKNLHQLRSLFMFGVQDSLNKASIPLLFGNNSRLLRVLDLTGTQLEVIPEEFFMLSFLRYLSLRDTKVKFLPSAIEKLQDLETLDLKRTGIAELPEEISKLKKLRHILVYRFEKESYMPYHNLEGFMAPKGIGQLLSLQKLCFVDTNQGGDILQELGKLEQLRRLGITKLKKEDGKVLCSSIEKLTSLRSLNIHSAEEDEIIEMQHMISPPQFLQRLYLHGKLEKLPDWIAGLHSLVKILLRWSQLIDDLVEPLGKLPNLMELQLRRAYNGTSLNFVKGSFLRLKILLLDELEELKEIKLENESVTCLEEFTISRCPMLEKVPEGIEHLRELKLLQLFNMPEDLTKTINRTNNGEDYDKVAHIPQVYATNWKNSHWERSVLSRGNMSNRNDEKGKSVVID
ncbi:Disease resistance protein [Corchorus capsularis]|uniref:Disease resistance protein n=1 Tax=Corchorus capsularis TaxID=210143 RepID=A0A1R3GMT5_COCAP|nr:Disease resistance protein [Corchorus capsularis]